MNYKEIYFAFMDKCRDQEFEQGQYTEKHHIIPRHIGGDDSPENIIKLTFRQHVFAHRLLWKGWGRIEDKCAYLLMNGSTEEGRRLRGQIAGNRNVESGHLDRIREMANTPERQRKLSELNQYKVDSGLIKVYQKMAHDAWRGQKHTDEWKIERSALYKERYATDQKYIDHQKRISRMAADSKKAEANMRSDDVIANAERNEEYLSKVSNLSSYYFISPEGLVFHSPTYAALYYGNVKVSTVENWCKRGNGGWKRVPKTGGD